MPQFMPFREGPPFQKTKGRLGQKRMTPPAEWPTALGPCSLQRAPGSQPARGQVPIVTAAHQLIPALASPLATQTLRVVSALVHLCLHKPSPSAHRELERNASQSSKEQ